ncbi:MAG: S1C family serine protease [Acidimicrobiales bacterium]
MTEPDAPNPQEGQDEPTLLSDPTREVPAAAPPFMPPPSMPQPSMPPPSMPPPPAAPWPGGGYGAPHYGPPAAGWGQYPWTGAPGAAGDPASPAGPGGPGGHQGGPLWQWQPPPPPRSASAAPGWTILAALTAAAVAIAAVLGVVIGHSLWKTAQNAGSNPSLGSPFGGGGSTGTTTPGSGSGSGSNSSAAGGPSNAAAIAKEVDPGLVDVNIVVDYNVAEGAGTGMVLTPNGEVLTNNHVIEGATTISVTDVGNGKTYTATVVGYDRSHDVAVLQLNGASGLQTVSLGNSSNISNGDAVVAIGNANGTGGTPSYAGGSITATKQSITATDELSSSSEQLSGLLETNADIISGDSGGPLVNTSGQVIGMDTASSEAGGGFQFQSPSNEGFAIPVNQAVTTAKSAEAGVATTTVHIGQTAFLGVQVAPGSSCPSSGGFGGFGGFGGSGNGGSSGSASGALICGAVTGSPAAQAGISNGDVITSVDGHAVTSANTLTDVMVADEKPNTTVKVLYTDSSGNSQSASVKLSAGPPQ